MGTKSIAMAQTKKTQRHHEDIKVSPSSFDITYFVKDKSWNYILLNFRLIENSGPGAHWSEMGNFKQKLFLMKQCSDKWLLHTTGLLTHQGSQKNCKRPMKVTKAKSKARHYQKSKFYSFFICLGSLGADWSGIYFGSNSKVIKAEKAAITAQNRKSNLCNFIGQNLVFPQY